VKQVSSYKKKKIITDFYKFLGDICIPNPCMNGGTCQSQGVLSFTCQCRPGFQGLTCQICKCLKFMEIRKGINFFFY
jgi:hypothetical protein